MKRTLCEPKQMLREKSFITSFTYGTLALWWNMASTSLCILTSLRHILPHNSYHALMHRPNLLNTQHATTSTTQLSHAMTKRKIHSVPSSLLGLICLCNLTSLNILTSGVLVTKQHRKLIPRGLSFWICHSLCSLSQQNSLFCTVHKWFNLMLTKGPEQTWLFW